MAEPTDRLTAERLKAEEEESNRLSRESSVQRVGLYCDAFHLVTWRGHVRISLGEYFDRAYYRTAVVMPLEDARSLANNLLEEVKKQEERDLKGEREDAEAP
jgi:hypothetical protein